MSRIFSFPLYKDFFKQLRTLGFIGTILTAGSTLINITNYLKTRDFANMHTMYSLENTYMFNFFLIVVLFTPLMALTIYSFQNKRASSDYYHSFPCKRSCLYLTAYAALLTWIAIITYLPLIISILVYTVGGIKIQIMQHFLYTSTLFVASILVSSVISLSCALTGNRFTNVIATGLILFLPTLLLCSMAESVMRHSLILTENSLPVIFTPKPNIIFFILTTPFEIAPLYLFVVTLVFSIIATLLGLYCFIRRPSETAGKSTYSKILHEIFKISIGLSILIIDQPSLDSSEELIYVIYRLFFAAMLMLIFEYFSSKNTRNLLKVIPSIGILMIAYILYFLTEFGLYHVCVNNGPDPNSTKQLTIELNSFIGEVTSTDKDAISIVNKYYMNCVENCSMDNDYMAYLDEHPLNLCITYKKNGFKHERRLYVSSQELSQISEAFTKKSNYSIGLEPSILKDSSLFVDSEIFYRFDYNIDTDFDNYEFLSIYLNELQSLTFKDVIELSAYNSNNETRPYVKLDVYKGHGKSRLFLYIDQRLPKTLKYIEEHFSPMIQEDTLPESVNLN